MKFYDTNAVLTLGDKLKGELFLISTVTLHELENIKTSKSKTEDVRYKARKAVHFLTENKNCFMAIPPGQDIYKILEKAGVQDTPDNLICATAKYVSDIYFENDIPVTFVTDDLCCNLISENVFHLKAETVNEVIGGYEEYTGWKELYLNDEELAYLYSNMTDNRYGVLQNGYLIVKNADDSVIDILKWDGTSFSNVQSKSYKGSTFGTVKPYLGDPYQICALDSLSSNQVTVMKGPAGTGKSYLGLGYLLYKLDKHDIEKIVVFVNPTPTANSAKIGFYPGTRIEKLMESNIGNMLSSKLGDSCGVYDLIDSGKLILLPMCDIRGFDTTNMRAGIYITEAQNMDISLMKLALQRIGADCIAVIEGDDKAQVDNPSYDGSNNGMRRMSEVFRGQDVYGEVMLKNIYRSKIAAIADRM